jgi:hypothetical protein
LQLADISAAVIRNYHLHSLETVPVSGSLFHEKLKEYYVILKARSIDRRIGAFNVSGIFCPPREYNV